MSDSRTPLEEGRSVVDKEVAALSRAGLPESDCEKLKGIHADMEQMEQASRSDEMLQARLLQTDDDFNRVLYPKVNLLLPQTSIGLLPIVPLRSCPSFGNDKFPVGLVVGIPSINESVCIVWLFPHFACRI